MFTLDGYSIFSSVQVGALRMLVAAVVLFPVAWRHRKVLRCKTDVFFFLLVGLCGNFFPAFLFTYAETGISSGYAGMLNSFTPIFALLIGFSVFRERLSRLQTSGVAIGMSGVAMLMISGGQLAVSGDWSHIFSVVLATICYAISLNVIKYKLTAYSGLQVTSISFFLMLIPAFFVVWESGVVDTFEVNVFAWEGFAYLLILSVVGTALAVLLFNNLIAMASVLFASSVTYLIPIVAVLIGLAYGERISGWQVVAMGVVLSGVFIANYLDKRLKSKIRVK